MKRGHVAALLLSAAILTACGDAGESADTRTATTSAAPLTARAEPDRSEAAWRTALGLDVIPDNVWRRYRDSIDNICDSSESGFRLTVSMMLDDNDLEGIDRFRKSLPYACPEYVDLFNETITLTDNPCAKKTAEERREYERIMRALGERGWTCP